MGVCLEVVLGSVVDHRNHRSLSVVGPPRIRGRLLSELATYVAGAVASGASMPKATVNIQESRTILSVLA